MMFNPCKKCERYDIIWIFADAIETGNDYVGTCQTCGTIYEVKDGLDD